MGVDVLSFWGLLRHHYQPTEAPFSSMKPTLPITDELLANRPHLRQPDLQKKNSKAGDVTGSAQHHQINSTYISTLLVFLIVFSNFFHVSPFFSICSPFFSNFFPAFFHPKIHRKLHRFTAGICWLLPPQLRHQLRGLALLRHRLLLRAPREDLEGVGAAAPALLGGRPWWIFWEFSEGNWMVYP